MSVECTSYKVLINQQGQYTLWPDDLPAPAGWSEADKAGPREECLAYVKAVWTDMRPRGQRRLAAAG